MADQILDDLDFTDDGRSILIAGPTASGKSAIALAIAERHGGTIVNGDALQVFDNWRLLTARPSLQEEKRAPHRLYGHVSGDADYSVGHWLRDIAPLVDGNERLIIVGGTGLNFTALSEGLVEIPPTPPALRQQAEEKMSDAGVAGMLADLDAETISRIDVNNPVRVQRAWEVVQGTGRGLASWQDNTPPAMLPLSKVQTVLLEADRDWLAARIERRFHQMVDQGAIHEVEQNIAQWDPTRPSSKAIGVKEIISHLRGETTLEHAIEQAVIATRQYAKRQRTWFRSRMKSWNTHQVSR